MNNERLQRITKRVEFEQEQLRIGEFKSVVAKSLREAIFFNWEKQEGLNKHDSTIAKSVGSQAAGCKRIYDHAIPITICIDRLLNLNSITTKSVGQILDRYSGGVTITQDEDKLLNANGLKSKMPDDWDGEDRFARYKAVGIQLV